jgi:hypothetical protein
MARDRQPRTIAVLRIEWGNRCQKCGASGDVKKLEFAHVKPTGLCGQGRGSVHRYYDIKRNPECYRLLCRQPCHKQFDDDMWARKRRELDGRPDPSDVIPEEAPF